MLASAREHRGVQLRQFLARRRAHLHALRLAARRVFLQHLARLVVGAGLPPRPAMRPKTSWWPPTTCFLVSPTRADRHARFSSGRFPASPASRGSIRKPAASRSCEMRPRRARAHQCAVFQSDKPRATPLAIHCAGQEDGAQDATANSRQPAAERRKKLRPSVLIDDTWRFAEIEEFLNLRNE